MFKTVVSKNKKEVSFLLNNYLYTITAYYFKNKIVV